MKKVMKKMVLIWILAIAITPSYAQYEIKKYTINNGGGEMTGGDYVMNSSIGQVDASDTQTGGNYSLNGGFWYQAGASSTDLIFKNGFE